MLLPSNSWAISDPHCLVRQPYASPSPGPSFQRMGFAFVPIHLVVLRVRVSFPHRYRFSPREDAHIRCTLVPSNSTLVDSYDQLQAFASAFDARKIDSSYAP